MSEKKFPPPNSIICSRCGQHSPDGLNWKQVLKWYDRHECVRGADDSQGKLFQAKS